MDNLGLRSIAVLIDADNAQVSKLGDILDEISKYGRVTVKKAYGDWNGLLLKNWTEEIVRLAIKPEQQIAYTKGKNATDIALVIDAMDLLCTGNYDGYAIVSSDADFTPLIMRLHETGVYIFGFGEEKTPAAFRNSCDYFIFTEHLQPKNGNIGVKAEQEPEKAKEEEKPHETVSIKEIHKLLKAASEAYQDESGWANASNAGSYIQRSRPEFTPKIFGFSKLSNLLKHYNDIYELKMLNKNVFYKIKKAEKIKPAKKETAPQTKKEAI